MAQVKIVFFQKARGSAPALEFILGRNGIEQKKIDVKIQHLQEKGHELGHPHCRYLEERIHELRARAGNLRLRLLYFFHGSTTAVLSHGFVKKARKVPLEEIRKALRHKRLFEADPTKHAHPRELGGNPQ